MFEKIMGRPWMKADTVFSYLIRLNKHLLNPKATLERVLYGPIFGTHSKS
jgi:hypothetical protein